MNEKSDELVSVEASVDGAKAAASGKVVLSKQLPGVLGRMLPVDLVGKRNIKRAIYERITEKIRKNEAFDPAEVEFVSEVLGDSAAKFIRRESILARAIEIVNARRSEDASDREVARLPADASPGEPHISPEDGVETSTDWWNRYLEDAGLVDDEMMSELLAQVLAEEAMRPGAVTRRTLGVLRNLDRQTAENFLKVVEILIAGVSIPEQNIGKEALGAVGLDHQMLLDLDDAGLVNAGATSQQTWRPRGQHVVMLPGQSKAVLVSAADGKDFEWSLRVHLLTPAGRQLARIVHVESNGEVLEALLRVIQKSAKDAKLLIADLPSSWWSGPTKDLSWKEWRSA